MRATALFLTLAIAAACDSGGGTEEGLACATLPEGQLAGGIQTPQVMIEAKIVAVSSTFLQDVGVDVQSIAVQKDGGGVFGGQSKQGKNVVVGSDTVGGPSDVPYLVTNGFDGLLSILNLNFLSPFAGSDVKVYPGLPFPGQCVRCADAATTMIQGFAGGSNAGVLPPVDPGLQGMLLYDTLDDDELQTLLDLFEAEASAKIIGVPVVRVLAGQRTIVGLQDVNPQVSDLRPDFRAAIQSVVMNPFEMSTGVTLDVVPTVDASGAISLDIRLGTELVSAQRSVPATVGGVSADVEIPFVRSSTNHANILLPNGTSLVIGGIHKQGDPEPTGGLPLLGSLPLIGNLFTHKLTDPEQQNLVILITPRIIDE